MEFGRHVRLMRERLKKDDRRFSIRRVAERIGVEPAYLSKIERGEVRPPSEEKIVRLAAEIGEDADLLLSMAGKIASDLKEIITQRPQLFAPLLRRLKTTSNASLLALGGEKGSEDQRRRSKERRRR